MAIGTQEQDMIFVILYIYDRSFLKFVWGKDDQGFRRAVKNDDLF